MCHAKSDLCSPIWAMKNEYAQLWTFRILTFPFANYRYVFVNFSLRQKVLRQDPTKNYEIVTWVFIASVCSSCCRSCCSLNLPTVDVRCIVVVDEFTHSNEIASNVKCIKCEEVKVWSKVFENNTTASATNDDRAKYYYRCIFDGNHIRCQNVLCEQRARDTAELSWFDEM